MKIRSIKPQFLFLATAFALFFYVNNAIGQYNTLWIPDTLSGTTFNLNMKDTFKQVRPGNQTITGGGSRTSHFGQRSAVAPMVQISAHGDTQAPAGSNQKAAAIQTKVDLLEEKWLELLG